MGKKKKSNKFKFNKDILGIIIIVLGLISTISLFTNKVGLAGSVLSNSIFSLMGFGGYIFPAILIIFGIFMILDKISKENIKLYIVVASLYIIFLIFLDSTNIGIESFIGRMKEAISLSKSNNGGGLIGSFLGFFFYKLFGKIGGYIVLFFSTVALTLILFNISLKDIYSYIKMLVNDINEKRLKRKKISKNNTKTSKEKINKEKAKKIEKSKKDEIQILDYNEKDNSEYKEKDTKKEIKNKNTIYKKPPIDLLFDPVKQKSKDKKGILKNAQVIEDTMDNFGIDSKVTQINKGPTITCYELSPSPGVKLSKIVSLSDNISLSLASSDIRIEAPIPGKSAVGIEVPNKVKNSVMLKEIIASNEYESIDSNVPIALGKDVSGNSVVSSIDKMPHLLIAGATGSGKSVCINTIIMSILYKSSPEDVKLLLIDPKVVELSIYNKIPHLLIPVVTDPKKASFALSWAVEEMDKRYDIFAENNVRDIASYNRKVKQQEPDKEDKLEKMSSTVIIIDELSDLMMVAAQEVEDYICRLAQMARAAGIYLIIATQRPSVDVITGIIKANIPSRISFSVSSQVDSRTILDMGGAEKLLGKGDMLFYPSFFSKPLRIQGAFISDDEVESIVDFLSDQYVQSYDEEIIESMEKTKSVKDIDSDELLPEAVEIILEENQASISFLQRKLRVGYARAARIIDDMEEHGIVGGHEGSKPRKILVTREDVEKMDIL